MSTRAIIAMPVKDGYETAWCWNDGYPDNLGRELRRYFKTEENARKLLDLHSFSSIQGPEFILEFIKDKHVLDGDKIIALSTPNPRYIIMHSNDGKVIAGKGKHGFFNTLNEMLDQDLNYVYVFENGKWKTYK